MGCCHDLDGVGDQLPARQRILHADVIHGNAVANPDHPEFNGSSTRHIDSCLNRFYDFVQMNMAGDHGVDGIGNTDERLFDFCIRVPHGFKQGAMGCPFHPFFNQVAFHRRCLLKKKPLSASGLITVFVFLAWSEIQAIINPVPRSR